VGLLTGRDSTGSLLANHDESRLSADLPPGHRCGQNGARRKCHRALTDSWALACNFIRMARGAHKPLRGGRRRLHTLEEGPTRGIERRSPTRRPRRRFASLAASALLKCFLKARAMAFLLSELSVCPMWPKALCSLAVERPRRRPRISVLHDRDEVASYRAGHANRRAGQGVQWSERCRLASLVGHRGPSGGASKE